MVSQDNGVRREGNVMQKGKEKEKLLNGNNGDWVSEDKGEKKIDDE